MSRFVSHLLRPSLLGLGALAAAAAVLGALVAITPVLTAVFASACVASAAVMGTIAWARPRVRDAMAVGVDGSQGIWLLGAAAVAVLPAVELSSLGGLAPPFASPLLILGTVGLVVPVLLTSDAAGTHGLNRAAATLTVLYVVALLVAAYRNDLTAPAWAPITTVSRVGSWISYLVLVVVLGMRAASPASVRLLAWAVLGAPVLMLALCVFLYLTRITPAVEGTYTGSGQASLLAILGYARARVTLPLMFSANGSGLLAGLVLALGLTIVIRRHSHRIWRAFGLIALLAGAYVLLLTDSRGPLLWAVASGVAASRLAGSWKRLLYVPIALTPVSAILLKAITTVATGSSLSFAARDQSGDLVTGRTAIWDPVIRFLSDDPFGNLLGHGLFAQSPTGLSEIYNDPFIATTPNADLLAVHNVGLQVAIDFGFIGLAVFVALLLIQMRTFLATTHLVGSCAAACLCYLAGVGWSEAVMSEATPYLMLPFLGLIGLGLTLPALGRDSAHG